MSEPRSSSVDRASRTFPPAVVVGLDSITGLQAVRSLARRGVFVYGIASDRAHFAGRSRACREVIYANTRTSEFLEALEALAPRLPEPAVLVPCSDLTVRFLSRHRERFSTAYRMALPDPETVETLMNKAAFHRFAEARGLPVPRGFVVGSRADVEAAARSIGYPCVLKPDVKTSRWQASAGAKAFKVADEEDLLSIYDRVSRLADELIVQEWIRGDEQSIFGCYCVFDGGSSPVASFVSRKIRQWPPETGSTSLCVAVRDEEVLRMGLSVFRRVKYLGIGHVELKRDGSTGRTLIVEVNVGRPTVRSFLAERDGVDLHYALYRVAAGLPPPPVGEQRGSGVKWVYLKNDALAAARAWRQGRLTAREWWRSWKGPKVDAVFSWSDPVPFLVDVGRTAGRSARRRVRAAASLLRR